MTGITRVELGDRRPDGAYEVAVVDERGSRHKAIVADPRLVEDYVAYLGTAGLDRPIVTAAKPSQSRASRKPGERGAAVPVGKQLARLVAIAARAPSVHNTQPWRFRSSWDTIELLADPRRQLLRVDPSGREMLISCGAALFGLRLAMRELGCLPQVRLLPNPAQPDVLARVCSDAAAPITTSERRMLAAMPRRHTHRGPFTGEALPRGLLPGLQHDAVAEGAALALIDQPGPYRQLSALVAAADRQQYASPLVRAEVRRWSRPAGSPARDGVPAHACPAATAPLPGRLTQRDFGLGHRPGLLAVGGPPAATAVLITPTDSRADWLRAGQALHRLLLHAASRWVFASLHTQPLESPAARAQITARLGLPGAAQMVLQLGHSRTGAATARRPPDEIVT